MAFFMQTYAVDVVPVDNEESARLQGPQVLRSRRLSPRDSLAAVVTFHWTDYPGVMVDAGAFFSAAYPMCGCRACDETCASAVNAMEDDVFSWVQGRTQERVVHEDADEWRVETARTGIVGSQIETSTASHVSGIRLRTSQPGLSQNGFESSWAPWPERDSA